MDNEADLDDGEEQPDQDHRDQRELDDRGTDLAAVPPDRVPTGYSHDQGETASSACWRMSRRYGSAC
jgi:hypothetical protein